MKSRGLTYLLLVVVLGVWGVVAWKLFFPGPKETIPGPVAVSGTREDLHIADDTLRLDYPDPFLRMAAAKPSAPAPVPVTSTVRPAVRKERAAAQLTCTGRIRKQGTDRYLVSVDGHVHLLRQGESGGGFTLRQLRGDSLVMVRDGQSYSVKIP